MLEVDVSLKVFEEWNYGLTQDYWCNVDAFFFSMELSSPTFQGRGRE